MLRAEVPQVSVAKAVTDIDVTSHAIPFLYKEIFKHKKGKHCHLGCC